MELRSIKAQSGPQHRHDQDEIAPARGRAIGDALAEHEQLVLGRTERQISQEPNAG